MKPSAISRVFGIERQGRMGQTRALLLLVLCLVLVTWLSPTYSQAIGDMERGQGGSEIKGNSDGGTAGLERCQAPLGTVAVIEPQNIAIQALMQYSLPSPTQLIRLIIQQSNCFMVVERGVGMTNMMQERQLSGAGETTATSNMGKGQMVSADYIMTPQVAFKSNNAGGGGAGIAGLFRFIPVIGGAVAAVGGAVAANVKFKQAQTTLGLSDSRSGIQVAMGTGSAEKADFGLGGFGAIAGAGGLGALGLGAYENTPEGKVVVSAFLDAYNQVVKAVKDRPELRRQSASLNPALAGNVQAQFAQVGNVLRAKINGVKMFPNPNKSSKPVFSLKRNEEVVAIGGEENSFIKVQGEHGEGWVETALMGK